MAFVSLKATRGGFTVHQALLVWYSGLIRGAVSVALCLQLKGMPRVSIPFSSSSSSSWAYPKVILYLHLIYRFASKNSPPSSSIDRGSFHSCTRSLSKASLSAIGTIRYNWGTIADCHKRSQWVFRGGEESHGYQVSTGRSISFDRTHTTTENQNTWRFQFLHTL